MDTRDFEEEIISISTLGDPIRRRLYAFVVGVREWVNRDQAAAELGMARHIVKFHLDKLEDEGLLEVEYKRPSGRQGPGAGRPTKFYRRSPREISVTLPARHYDFAGGVLARAIVEAKEFGTPIADALRTSARSAGQSIAKEVSQRIESSSSETTLDQGISEILAVHGYEPIIDQQGISLLNCPFHSLAKEYTSLVCGMNEDLIDSLLKNLPTDMHALLDPEVGRCCVKLVR